MSLPFLFPFSFPFLPWLACPLPFPGPFSPKIPHFTCTAKRLYSVSRHKKAAGAFPAPAVFGFSIVIFRFCRFPFAPLIQPGLKLGYRQRPGIEFPLDHIVQLDGVHIKLHQHAQGGKSRTEIVQGNMEAQGMDIPDAGLGHLHALVVKKDRFGQFQFQQFGRNAVLAGNAGKGLQKALVGDMPAGPRPASGAGYGIPG